MRSVCLVCLYLLCLSVSSLLGAEGAEAQYIGGTVALVKDSAMGRIQMKDPDFFRFTTRKGEVSVPFSEINLIEYGQQANRRVAMAILISPMFLLTKNRTHFLTVGYTDGDGRQQAMVFRVGKSRVRSVLVSLEAKTGRKVEYQDEEARKAGKG